MANNPSNSFAVCQKGIKNPHSDVRCGCLNYWKRDRWQVPTSRLPWAWVCIKRYPATLLTPLENAYPYFIRWNINKTNNGKSIFLKPVTTSQTRLLLVRNSVWEGPSPMEQHTAFDPSKWPKRQGRASSSVQWRVRLINKEALMMALLLITLDRTPFHRKAQLNSRPWAANTAWPTYLKPFVRLITLAAGFRASSELRM